MGTKIVVRTRDFGNALDQILIDDFAVRTVVLFVENHCVDLIRDRRTPPVVLGVNGITSRVLNGPVARIIDMPFEAVAAQ